MGIETLLRDEIRGEFDELKKMRNDIGTDQYKTTVDGLTKLVDRAIELEKLEMEHQEKVISRENDTDFKFQQMKEDKKDRVFKNAIAVASIAVPSIITIWGTVKSIQFEKEGTITTIMGRGFINKLLPKK